jgi:hypothetical protein
VTAGLYLGVGDWCSRGFYYREAVAVCGCADFSLPMLGLAPGRDSAKYDMHGTIIEGQVRISF